MSPKFKKYYESKAAAAPSEIYVATTIIDLNLLQLFVRENSESVCVRPHSHSSVIPIPEQAAKYVEDEIATWEVKNTDSGVEFVEVLREPYSWWEH